MSQPANSESALRVADLPQNRPVLFDLRPDAEALQQIAAELELKSLRKLSFRGSLKAQGARDWLLEGVLGATVVQPCVATLEPVTTRIDEPVRRLYLADPAPILPEGEEVEMPEDDTAEPLGSTIDPYAVMIEALALALPLWPRADGAEIGEVTVTEPGRTALTKEAMKPFAGLAGLRDKLGAADKDNE
ncbi:MAG: YceD family protein [Rhodobacterales bacterium]